MLLNIGCKGRHVIFVVKRRHKNVRRTSVFQDGGRKSNEEHAFFASEEHKKYDLWSCQKVTDALIYLLDNIYIRFGAKLYRQNVGIPMGTNYLLLLTCFCSAMRGTS